jgi:hypothetical protein
MQELFSIKQSYIYYLFKQILKYKILKRWENLGSFACEVVARALGQANVPKCAVGFFAWHTTSGYQSF